MFRLFLVVLLLCALRAEAQPACWPAQIGGSGSAARVEHIAPTTRTPIGMGAVDALWWLCPATAARSAKHEVFFCPMLKRGECLRSITQLTPAALQAAWLNAPPTSIDAAGVRWAFDIWESRWARDEIAALAPTTPVWWVPKASSSASPPLTRPTFTFSPSGPTSIVLDGGRVSEFSICACGTARFPASGDPTHCSVLGSPQKLAICVRRAP